MAGCLVVLLVWRGLKSIFAGCLHGLGGSGFGVKSVFAGCLHGLATFWTGLSMFFCVFLAGLAYGLEGYFCWVSRGFGWFGIWFGGIFFGLLCFSSVVLIYIHILIRK